MNLNDWGRVLTSVFVVIGFITVTLVYMTQKLNGNPVPEILSILLGALATNFTSVVGYWIGSSSGSASKDNAIQKLANQAPPVVVIVIGFGLGVAISKAWIIFAVAA